MIAAVPVMREHHLYVMSLEEFPPNREFVGRNFNAGEVIQLVLRSPSTGRWLPFEYVQMVMMHELAHCKQMNHSRAFWAVRNAYASQMQGLWTKGYTGDGVWGRGTRLDTGEWERNTVRADEVLPEHLCGGTYRSRRRKRKAKPVVSYQERKQRRIEKKFGKHGQALGEDEEAKVKLEKGKKVKGKPRVAGSARGRDLRAAAALARFEQQKEEMDVKQEVKHEEDDDETDSGSGSDHDGDGTLEGQDALDLDGSRLVDDKGRGLVKVCEDEDEADPDANKELRELQDVFRRKIKEESPESEVELVSVAPHITAQPQETSSSSRATVLNQRTTEPPKRSRRAPSSSSTASGASDDCDTNRVENMKQQNKVKVEEQAASSSSITDHESSAVCAVCSFANAGPAVTCSMCANVLNPDVAPNSWQCLKDPCRDTKYRNSGDCGVCGLCGGKRPE
jgi:hypothetical protein